VNDKYESAGKTVRQWSCFMELHKNGKPHMHLLIATQRPARWAEIARSLRLAGVFCHVRASISHNAYWSAFAYLYCPSSSKPRAELDAEYVLSQGPRACSKGDALDIISCKSSIGPNC
jgi:hypothetical protein